MHIFKRAQINRMLLSSYLQNFPETNFKVIKEYFIFIARFVCLFVNQMLLLPFIFLLSTYCISLKLIKKLLQAFDNAHTQMSIKSSSFLAIFYPAFFGFHFPFPAHTRVYVEVVSICVCVCPLFGPSYDNMQTYGRTYI